MDIATIVRLIFLVEGVSHPQYHIRFSTTAQGPQREGAAKILDILYRRSGESEEAFEERATRYVETLDNDAA